MKHRFFIFFSVLIITPLLFSQQKTNQNELINTLQKVNNYWQTEHPDPGNAFWDNAAYQTGNMEAYFMTKHPAYLQYALKWAEKNEWKGAKGSDPTKWKYKYGESAEYVLFGDWQICFQTYIDLYNIAPDAKKTERAKEVMEYQMNTVRNDYWWWV
ncbi:MAG: glycoside hydrolase family 88 protein, partial [Paludibacteraceae bacterium]